MPCVGFTMFAVGRFYLSISFVHMICSTIYTPTTCTYTVWTASVARMVNPHLPIDETDTYGTNSMEKNINAKYEYALNAVYPNESDRNDAIAPDLGLGQDSLSQLMHADYEEWNNGNGIPETGAKSLTLVLCSVQQVLGIEYCPPLPDVGKLYAYQI